MTEKKKIAWEMPKREVVEQQEYVADTKLYGDVRHENSIVNYVSNDLAEKGKLAVVLMSLLWITNMLAHTLVKKRIWILKKVIYALVCMMRKNLIKYMKQKKLK